MRSLSVLAILLSIYFNGFSQKFVALSHNGVSSFFTGNNPVTDAVAAAVSGDTIYIPGGGFSVGNLSIDKTLTIYGVGHQPDSTSATLRTELSGSILLLQGASNSHLEGFYLTGDLNFGTSPGNQFLENIIIKRLNLQTLRLSYDGSSISASTNIFVEENIIRNELHAGYVSGLLISKNWIGQGFRYASNTLFTNNILFGGYCGGGPFSSIDNCMIQNNYIYASFGPCCCQYFVDGNTNHFSNNATNYNGSFPIGTNTGSGNWWNIAPSAFFVNCPGTGFDYSYDYHLQSPATYLGTDALQIGIYGTTVPSKQGWVPENPHVSNKIIAPQTDVNGDLNIYITVGAQEN